MKPISTLSSLTKQSTGSDSMISHKKVLLKGFYILRKKIFAGTFKWAETHHTAEYTNWSSHQPDNSAGMEDCVFKSLRNAPWNEKNIGIGWNDYSCDRDNYHDIGIFALCMIK